MPLATARWVPCRLIHTLLCAGLAMALPSAAAPERGGVAADPFNQKPLVQSASPPALPLTFFARRHGFQAVAPDLRVAFEADRVRLVGSSSGKSSTAGAGSNEAARQITMRFLGIAKPALAPQGEQLQTGHANFLLGDDHRAWERDVKLYAALRYRNLYPGIDLVYRGEDKAGGNSRLKSDWIVRPGARAATIAWNYAGARKMMVDDDGSLVAETAHGILREQRPIAYQDLPDGRREVDVRFRVSGNGDTAQVGFDVGQYDRSAPLIIDPVLAYSSYLGGTKNDVATAIALDSAGGVYVAGYTESGDMPRISGSQSFAGSVDAYIFHFNAGATQLIYATFLGGSGDDRAYGLDIDSSGNAYIVGSTASTNFPKYQPLQQSLNGTRDAFITKLSAAGNALIYSTYFGGSDSDAAYAVSVDPFGQPYIAGETASTNFPVKLPFQSTNHGGYDAFTLKLSGSGALVYSTYIGGSGNDGARGIAVSTNQLTPYLTGYTWSSDFPVWNPSQASSGGGEDAFLLRFNSDANALVYSTYLGGSGGSATAPEIGMAVAIDNFNNIYAVGTTSSVDFPVYLPYQATNHGGQDAWLRKLDSGGVLVYSTYLGGAGNDIANAVRVDALRRPYVVGYTSSSDFPSVQPAQAVFGGVYDAFVTEFEYTGLTLVASTVLGGSGQDTANGVAVDSTNGNAYIAGSTSSVNFPIQAAFRFTNAGVLDAFVAELTPSNVPPTPPAFLSLTPNQGRGSSYTFTVQVADANGANTMDSVQVLINASFSGLNSCHMAYVPATNLFYLLNNNATAFLGGLPPGTPTIIQNSQCGINVSTATAVKLGNLVTLTFPVVFTSSYSGNKLTYMLAVDTSGLRADWASYGIWTVP